MAISASVTVSIADDIIGVLRVIPSTISVSVETSPGITADSAGTKSTSSNVKPSTISILSTYPFNQQDLTFGSKSNGHNIFF